MPYVVSKYDVSDDYGKDGSWEEVASSPAAMGIRPALRGLLSSGYSEASISVDLYPDAATETPPRQAGATEPAGASPGGCNE